MSQLNLKSNTRKNEQIIQRIEKILVEQLSDLVELDHVADVRVCGSRLETLVASLLLSTTWAGTSELLIIISLQCGTYLTLYRSPAYSPTSPHLGGTADVGSYSVGNERLVQFFF